MTDNTGQEQNSKTFYDLLSSLSRKVESSPTEWNKSKHEGESRLEITKMFLSWFFMLIAFGFLFSAFYNFMAALINTNHLLEEKVPFLDVVNTVSIITTTLSSGVGFVIGYYFKNKDG